MLTKIMSSICMAISLLAATVATAVAATGSSTSEDGQLLPPSHSRGAGLDGVVVIDLPARPAPEDLVEGHARLEPGEVCAEAEMQTVPKAQVARDATADVETVAVGELPLI